MATVTGAISIADIVDGTSIRLDTAYAVNLGGPSDGVFEQQTVTITGDGLDGAEAGVNEVQRIVVGGSLAGPAGEDAVQTSAISGVISPAANAVQEVQTLTITGTSNTVTNTPAATEVIIFGATSDFSSDSSTTVTITGPGVSFGPAVINSNGTAVGARNFIRNSLNAISGFQDLWDNGDADSLPGNDPDFPDGVIIKYTAEDTGAIADYTITTSGVLAGSLFYREEVEGADAVQTGTESEYDLFKPNESNAFVADLTFGPPGGADQTTRATGLVAQINADPDWSASSSGAVITITSTNAGPITGLWSVVADHGNDSPDGNASTDTAVETIEGMSAADAGTSAFTFTNPDDNSLSSVTITGNGIGGGDKTASTITSEIATNLSITDWDVSSSGTTLTFTTTENRVQGSAWTAAVVNANATAAATSPFTIVNVGELF